MAKASKSERRRDMSGPLMADVRATTPVRPAARAPEIAATSYKPVGALLAGLAVLRHMANASSPLSLTEITRDVALNTSTCRNILRTLVDENYLVYNPQSKLYSMGLGVLELAGGAMSQGADMHAVRVMTDSIAVRENVTVTLWRRIRRDRMVLVVESLPPGNMSIKMNIGQRLPLLIGAAGRLMAAFSDLKDAEIVSQFKTVRRERQQSFRDFMDEVEVARERGWAIDDGYYTVGAASVAVPVLNRDGEALFAITATMFSAHFSLPRAEHLAAELRRPADLLVAALPYL